MRAIEYYITFDFVEYVKVVEYSKIFSDFLV